MATQKQAAAGHGRPKRQGRGRGAVRPAMLRRSSATCTMVQHPSVRFRSRVPHEVVTCVQKTEHVPSEESTTMGARGRAMTCPSWSGLAPMLRPAPVTPASVAPRPPNSTAVTWRQWMGEGTGWRGGWGGDGAHGVALAPPAPCTGMNHSSTASDGLLRCF